ncbi:hypothetical protein WR25_20308 [Diploscapter pachys]|uniref:Uncharacterized protein n=1 Tax=Diploscapter pachys TaxID=2018661 RepID=A0A2A2LPK1_9BILA|nr:hypothetical protein WR25_20308 [Diploscapter pachys]
MMRSQVNLEVCAEHRFRAVHALLASSRAIDNVEVWPNGVSEALALTAESTVGVVGKEFGRFGKFGILPPPVEPFAAKAEANLLAISELLNAAMKLAGLNGETPRLARA